MAYTLYDFVSSSGENEIKTWMNKLQKVERAKLNQKLDMLKLKGPDLMPHTLTGTDVPGIQKIRVQGGVKLRPLLCSGPDNGVQEFTLLMGAKEIGDRWSPVNAPEKALAKKIELISDIANRRKDHERVV